MSASPVKDLITAMEEDGIGVAGKDLYDQIGLVRHSPAHGVLVRQRNSSPEPDPVTSTDTALLTVTVAGAGNGGVAEERARALAFRIYKTYSLDLSRDINGTRYLSIIADAAPYEQVSGDTVDYVLGIRMTRYYGDMERLIWHQARATGRRAI